ncbi:amidase family protein [Nocardioides sp.]|uniref:amidase family protein n=1 Tax=Nocardioides sp. TaxID=35761 RepID=UPI0039E4E6E7
MSVSDLWRPWSLSELVADLAAGRTSPEAALERAEARIAETEPTIHAWVERHPSAPSYVAGVPLNGVPLGVKDIIDLIGYPTRCGSALRAEAAPAEADAAIVAAWRRTGAVPLGKTVTTEFAFFAPGPTANPANPGHTPGGSSSGSAAAVAAGQVPLALGSQTAGSVTRPAAYCGVAALVMSRGRFPTTGVAGLSESLDAHGVYAATPADLQVAWSALTSQAPITPARAPRVLLWDPAPLGPVTESMRAAVERARARLVAAGAEVVDLAESALIAETAAAHPVVMAYEAARERAAELAQADRLSEPLAKLLRTGAATTAEDYRSAGAVVASARSAVSALLTTHDLILGPAALGAAPAGLAATGDPILSRPWQALGLPQATIPGLRDEAGMPLGLQAIGPADGEGELLGRASWIAERL